MTMPSAVLLSSRRYAQIYFAAIFAAILTICLISTDANYVFSALIHTLHSDGFFPKESENVCTEL